MKWSVNITVLFGSVSFLMASTSILAGEYVNLEFVRTVQLTTNASCVDLEASGNYVYSAGNAEITALDITDPDSPVLIGALRFEDHGDPRAMYDTSLSGNRLYALSSHLDDTPEGPIYTYYFDVIDKQNPRQLAKLGTYQSDVSLSKVYAIGQHAIVLSDTNMLILDVSDPANIRRVVTIPETVQVLACEGNYGYGCKATNSLMFGSASGLEITLFDFTNPNTPRILGRTCISGGCGRFRSAEIKDGIGFFGWGAYYFGGCFMVDVRDRLHPTFLQEFGAGCWLTSITISDGFAFLTLHHTVGVYDIGDPQQAELAAYDDVRGAWTHQARLIGNHLFVGHEIGFDVYRITIFPYITHQSIANGKLNLKWHESAKGMKLQRTTSLTNPNWQDLLGSESTNFVSLPIWGGNEFFRLVKP